MIKTKLARMRPELLDFLKHRALTFNTNIPKEQTSLMRMMNEVEKQLGFDFKNMIVTSKGVTLNSKKRITILK